MKPFDLDKFLAGDEVVFRNGESPVEIHYFKSARFNIAPLLASSPAGHLYQYETNGIRFYPSDVKKDPQFDLFLKSKIRKGYINIYQSQLGSLRSVITESKAEADEWWAQEQKYLTNVKQIECVIED